MDDPLLVGSVERVGNLPRDRHRLVDRQTRRGAGSSGDPLGKCLAFDEFEDKDARRWLSEALDVFDTVDRCDVRMSERGESACLTFETREPVGILGELPRQQLERDIAAEANIPRPIDFAHAASTEWREHLIAAKAASEQ